MSQAKNPIALNRLSRRSALAGLSVAAAAGITPAIAATAAGDDAELLALKAKFDPLFSTWVAMKIAERENHKEFLALYERETGLRWDDQPAINWADPAFVACDNARNKCSEMLGDYNVGPNGGDAWDELVDKLDPLADKILSYNACTLDGLRLQLQALISAYDETWEPLAASGEGEPEHPWMRDFIESAAGVLGVPFPPFPIGGQS
jgi:hypothetical protein